MKTLINFARIILAPVFIFSGFVKVIDPLGSAYKFTDYFEAFGMDFLMPLSLVLGALLSITELLIGLNLLLGILMRITSWVLFIFMIFFTILTFILALTNPVTDCGCFGDAIVLTNWQTFWKNVVFLVPTLIVFFNRQHYKPLAGINIEWGVVLLFVLIGLTLSIYTYRNLPLIDFRPYKTGAHIPSEMIIPDGADMGESEHLFIYEKDGVKKEFALEELSEIDTTWTFIERKDKIIRKGYEPPIHNFSISTYDGDDITDSVLTDINYALLVVAYDIEKSNKEGLKKVNDFAKSVRTTGAMVYGLTSSADFSVDQISRELNLDIKFHICDEITLKTIVRSNPGVLLLKDGVIVGKWHYRNLPEIDELSNSALSAALIKSHSTANNWIIISFILALVLLMVILYNILRY